ncbi:Nuclear Hormone Receptor family [Caenorhabditis elegans]|uniref:Nuclear Hormone Receptor family n=1 Tax=Caenorhabditis elegans TaxID=6239 RepID=Q9XU11_CAEEL|nr:Nuclear Hormone Receptor family [Caenorhabditis elegans]CAB07282.2 Nuclear Hormone Receptor family [Caenorhabditis elegans]|eukprot:NP_507194.2 Nuclear Hormone Receptor family [Caenorhabditis elegans]
MCIICGSTEAELHFGGISCRACAAFFRRYHFAKRSDILCTCKTRISSSHPCRKCRIEKCKEAGLTIEKIQVGRDKHSNTLELSKNRQSLLAARVVFRETWNIHCAVFNWKQFEVTRNEVNNGVFDELNVFELSCSVSKDIDLTWKMIYKLFPSTGKLKKSDKIALLRNFIPKLWQIDPLLNYIRNFKKYEAMEQPDLEQIIINFYKGAMPEKGSMTDSEIVRIFKPFWSFYFHNMIQPIIFMKLKEQEFMAIIWLMFFDNGYSNISDECLEMCWNIRKVILRELRNYQIDGNCEESRLFETLESLEYIEKGERKLMEEMLICEINDLRIHDDFREILKESKL